LESTRTKKIIILLTTIIVVIAVVFVYQRLTNSPEKEVERAITLVQQNKIDQSGLSAESIKQIQEMLSLLDEETDTSPFFYYSKNSASTKQNPLVNVTFSFLIQPYSQVKEQLGEAQFYYGTLRVWLIKKSFQNWEIETVEDLEVVNSEKGSSTNDIES